MSMRRYLPSVFAASALVLAACSSASPQPSAQSEGGDKLTVLTSFYPVFFLTQKIGGDLVEVESLTPPGASAHHLELSPAKVAQIGQADAVVFAAGFQSAIDEAVAANPPAHVVDIAPMVQLLPAPEGEDEGHSHAHAGHDHDHAESGHDHAGHDHASHDHDHAESGHDHAGHDHASHDHDHDHGGMDPHFWLDPQRMAHAATAIGQALAKADPQNAQTYTTNAAAVAKDMNDLSTELVSATKECTHDTFVTAHTAFGYLAERAGLKQVGMSNIDPEAAPSPARLAEIAQLVKAKNITTIFSEKLIDPKVAQTLASDLGIRTASLDTLENQTDPAKDYTAVMKDNIQALRGALECK